MPNREKNVHELCGCGCMPYKTIFLGILLFVIGLMWHYNCGWDVILIVLGILFFLKGVWKSMRK